MSKDLMIQYFSQTEESRKIEMRLILQAAPFLKGMKESALLSVPNRLLNELLKLLGGLSVGCFLLHGDEKKQMLLLYHEEQLEEILKDAERTRFLQKYGYGMESLEEKLMILSSHMQEYYSRRGEFPHEIGVFLGYPQGDVEGFIANEGKNYLLSGYWKVYENESAAREKFACFDRARELAVHQLLNGMSLGEIAVA